MANYITELATLTVPVKCTNYCNADGTCSGCGNCCSNFLPLSKYEIVQISKYIKRHKIKAVEHYCAAAAEVHIDGVCPFRDDARGCLIYEVRPAICRAFQCNGSAKDCSIALRKMGYWPRHFELYDMRVTFCGEQSSLMSAAILEARKEQAYKAGIRFAREVQP